MNHTVAIFEKFLKLNGFHNERTIILFIGFLMNNGEYDIDKKEKPFIKAVIIGFLYIHSQRMFNKAIIDGIPLF